MSKAISGATVTTSPDFAGAPPGYKLLDEIEIDRMPFAFKLRMSVDDLNNPSRARFYKHGTLVDIRVTISGCVIFLGNFVVTDASFGQYGTDAEFLAVAI